MTRTASLLALFGAAAVVVPTALISDPASAHGIQSRLERISSLHGGTRSEWLEVESSFSSGIPASDAVVRLFPEGGGSPIELGHTGADGRFSFTLPPMARAGGEIQVDAGPGHRDYLELSDVEPDSSGKAPASQPRTVGIRRPWPGQASAALIVIGLVGGAGLFRRLRREA